MYNSKNASSQKCKWKCCLLIQYFDKVNLFSILKKVECNLDSSTFYIIAGGSKMSEFKVLKKGKKKSG